MSTFAATSVPESAAPTTRRPGGWLLAAGAAGYLAVMAFVCLPAYVDASTASIDPVSLGWLLAAGTLAPVGLAVASQRFTGRRQPAAADAAVAEVASVGLPSRPEQASASAMDALTGLRNYADFAEELFRHVERATEGSYPVSLAIIDVDQLAATNSELGQEAGDRLLVGLGRLVIERTRADDVAYRIGGDELAIVMPHCGAGRAQSVVRRLLLTALEEGESSADGREWSFSAGVSSYPELSGNPSALRRDAEAALRRAKRNGRTDVQLFDAFEDLSDDQRSEDQATQVLMGGDDSFTTGDQESVPIQLRFLPAEPEPAPEEWVDPRLVMIGLADAPAEANGSRRRRGGKTRSTKAGQRLAATRDAD